MRRALVAVVLFAACEDEGEFPGTPPPGSCVAGERVCYFEPVQERELALRCNDGEVEGAIWIIDDVCLDGEVCREGACVP
jgi:hypothetical protein